MKNYYGFHKIFRYVFAIFALAALISPELSAQKDYIDSKGRDFWLAFPPNFHNERYSGDPRLQKGDSLFIFIIAEEPTKGKIEYYDKAGAFYSEDFEITNPEEIFVFKKSWYDFELWGIEIDQFIGSITRHNSENISKQSFHITSDADIIVYGHSQAITTSESFMVMPTDALGNEHIIMSYYSDEVGALDFGSTPSQFVIVAPEGETEVTIKPSVETFYNGIAEQKITLKKGDTYLVQAKMEQNPRALDLTGTRIISDKPVAVFSGHQRALVPIQYEGLLNSRDVLIEQMPPVTTWGANAFLIPYKQPVNQIPEGSDLYRVLAAFDDTELFLNGSKIEELSAGEVYEAPLFNASLMTASKPIMVCQLKKSSQNSNTSRNGDPFLMLLPPKEQYLKSYRIINLQAYEFNQNTNDYIEVYNKHYITVTAPDEGIPSLRVDGKEVDQALFTSIPGSGFSYSHLEVFAGPHELSCDYPFGIFVYGYGFANSYGYVGGMGFENVNFPPVITGKTQCLEVEGEIIDTATSESALGEVVFLDEESQNTEVTFIDFVENARRVKYIARLINEFKDGKYAISARDTSGSTAVNEIFIKGKTISVAGYENAEIPPILDFKFGEIGSKIKIPLVNAGILEKTLTAVNNRNTALFNLDFEAPRLLKANERDTITLTIISSPGDFDKDSIFIETECGPRLLAVIKQNSDCDESAFEYPDFTGNTGLIYIREAKRVDSYLKLTSSRVNNTGAVWYPEKIPVRNGFETEFVFRFNYGDNGSANEGSLPGADGIAFVIQNHSDGAIGYSGGGIGYDNIPNSLAVEFDSFTNDESQLFNFNDPNGNHVAVQSMGQEKNTAAHTEEAMLGINPDIIRILPYGKLYYVKITYDLQSEEMRVYLEEKPDFGDPVLVIENLDIGALLKLEQGELAWVGFTSATGQAYENHEIISWKLCPKPSSLTNTSVLGPYFTEPDLSLLNVKPNPFENGFEVEYKSNSHQKIVISIYNSMGQKLADIYEGIAPAGLNSYSWNSAGLESGLYFITVRAGSDNYVRKAVKILK